MEVKATKNKRYDSGNAAKKARNVNNSLYLVVFVAAQLNMFVLTYAYHSSAGFVNLCWLIMSFVLSANNALFLSIVFMVPVLTWEFILIYCSRVPKIRETWFFQQYGKYFRIDRWNETLE